MKMRQINVPRDKCALDVLASMGNKTWKAWIFLHRNVIDKLSETASQKNVLAIYEEFVWNDTEKRSKTIIDFERKPAIWKRVCRIYSDDIEFRVEPLDPETIIFVKMKD